MGILDPKADAAEVAREIARLTGENMLLRQAVVLLLRRSPLRDELLGELRQDTGVLTHRVHKDGAHPCTALAMRDTLAAIERMTQP
jgi:hypothetical protein